MLSREQRKAAYAKTKEAKRAEKAEASRAKAASEKLREEVLTKQSRKAAVMRNYYSILDERRRLYDQLTHTQARVDRLDKQCSKLDVKLCNTITDRRRQRYMIGMLHDAVLAWYEAESRLASTEAQLDDAVQVWVSFFGKQPC